MSEPALRLEVSVPWSPETLILRNISFQHDGYISADFDSKVSKMSYFNYPAEFQLLSVKKIKSEDKKIVETGNGTQILKKILAQFEVKQNGKA